MKSFRSLVLVTAALTMLSCGRKAEESFTVSLNGKLESEAQIKYSDFLKDLEIVPLQNPSLESTLRFPDIYLSDNYILAVEFQKPARLFSRKDGAYLGPVAQSGNGPGELAFFPSWAQIDEDKGLIYIHDFKRRAVQSYDFKGNWLGEVAALAEGVSSRSFAFKINGGEITAFVIPNPGDSLMVVRQSLDGEVLGTVPNMFLKDPGEMFNNQFSIACKDGRNVLFQKFSSNELVSYDMHSGTAQTVLSIEPSEYEYFYPRLYDAGDYYMGTAYEEEAREVSEGSFSILQNKQRLVAIDKKTHAVHKAEITNDLFCPAIVNSTGISGNFDLDGHFIDVQQAPYLISLLDSLLKKPEDLDAQTLARLQSLREKINEEDNHILFIYNVR